MISPPSCRFCGAALTHTFADLGTSPLSNSYRRTDELSSMEPFYPLRALVCDQCLLVQLPVVQAPDRIFTDYAYFSSYSQTWLDHSAAYAESIVQRFGFDRSSRIVEIASNDGYLLRFFRSRGIPVLGIEPAANVARAAERDGIPTLVRFFGSALARDLADHGQSADLLIGNNVLAHVPDLNDFVAGIKLLLKPDGVLTMEFPHLLRLIADRQFDTIYHEHFSYFSFLTARQVFARHGITLFDVEQLSTHGGSLRIFGRHTENRALAVSPAVSELIQAECEAGLGDPSTYSRFQQEVEATKRDLLSFLISAKQSGKRIVGYGAPAKGNTLLNYCGIRTDFLDCTVDCSPHKQGFFLPGTHIPILAPDAVRGLRPDYLLILPWNLKSEIMAQMEYIREWGGQFVVPIPRIEIL